MTGARAGLERHRQPRTWQKWNFVAELYLFRLQPTVNFLSVKLSIPAVTGLQRPDCVTVMGAPRCWEGVRAVLCGRGGTHPCAGGYEPGAARPPLVCRTNPHSTHRTGFAPRKKQECGVYDA